MRGAERLGDLLDERQHEDNRQAAALGDALAQRLALEQLHEDVGRAVAVLAEVPHAHDAGVHDLRRRARLVHEAALDRRVAGELLEQHLDRDLALEQEMLGDVDRPHPAFAELREHAVAAELCSDHPQRCYHCAVRTL